MMLIVSLTPQSLFSFNNYSICLIANAVCLIVNEDLGFGARPFDFFPDLTPIPYMTKTSQFSNS